MLKNKVNFFVILGLFLFAVLMGVGYMPYYANEDDTLETLFAGRDWGLSHHKHPPVSVIEARVFFKLFGFGGYLLMAPIQMAVMLSCLFFLALDILKDQKKAILVLLLALAITFYVSYLKFNANTAGYAFYGLITLLFYRALVRRRYGLFLPISILAVLIFLLKYSGIVLLASFAVVLFITYEGRRALRSAYPYIGGLIFLLAAAAWFFIKYKHNNNSFGLEYLAHSVQKQNTPLIFYILSQVGYLAIFLGVFFLMRPKFKGFKGDFNSVFLLVTGVIPLVSVPVVFDLFVGGGPMAFWMISFYFLLPLAAVYFFDFRRREPAKFSAKIIIPVISIIVLLTVLQRNIRPFYDTKGISDFIKSATQNKDINYYICHRNGDHPLPCYYFYLYNQDKKIISYDGVLPIPPDAKNFALVSMRSEPPALPPHYKVVELRKSFDKIYKIKSFISCKTKICKKLLKETRPLQDDVYLYIITDARV